MKDKKKTEDIAWELFKKTGSISFYELYKNLKK